MRGPLSVPTPNALLKAYNLVQSSSLTVKLIREFTEFARFDPRFAEMMTKKIAEDWESLDPYLVNRQLSASPWGSAFGVLLENAESLILKPKKKAFRVWKKMVMMQIPPAAGEQFWVGSYPFAGPSARRVPHQSLTPYLKWGYYGEDWLINKATSKVANRTMIPKSRRYEILKQLASNQSFFRLHEYLEALGHLVHRRTAEMDLQNAKFIKKVGSTKGCLYKLAGRKR